MWQEILASKKVQGSILVGLALVGGAYVASNFGSGRVSSRVTQPNQVVYVSEPREYINVYDSNNDGIEDWREEFARGSTIVINNNNTSQTNFEPTTVTSNLSVQFMESVIRSRGQGSVIGANLETIVNQTADRAQNLTRDRIYNTRDIIIIPTDNNSIRTYGNTMGGALIDYNPPNAEDELTVINRALQNNSPEELEKLRPVYEMYGQLRDRALNTPVPDRFVNQHLDLINVYNALYHTLSESALIFDDPVVALMRVKRYQDDATGLAIALRNMYNTLIPHAALFSVEDPAAVFIVFADRR